MKEPNLIINNKILMLIAEIDGFKGEWKAIGNLAPDRLMALKKVASIESIGSSTRIEGANLSDQEIELLLSGLDTSSFSSRDEEEVAGYAEVVNLVFESFDEISNTENHIKQLHRILLKYSTQDTRHRGEYKKLPNHVEAFDKDGKSLGIIFKTATPFETPLKMQELIKWTEQKLTENDLHPLLIIAVFVLHFLAIHPFQDGNGRLSRILTTLLLLRSGYAYVPYSSLESIIEKNKDNYYLALRTSQKNIYSEDNDLEAWILFFLGSLKAQKDILSKKIEREQQMVKLPDLSMQILKIVKEHGRATISNIQEITNTNRNTIKVRLRELVENNYLIKQGKGKATWYIIGSNKV